MEWLIQYEFYLSQEVCDQLNNDRREIEAKFKKDTTVRIVYHDLVPDEEMNDSYFIDE